LHRVYKAEKIKEENTNKIIQKRTISRNVFKCWSHFD